MSLNLKEQLMLMKSKAKEQTSGNTMSSFIQYKKVIKEAIKQNKEEPLYKQFKNEIKNTNTITITNDNEDKKDKDKDNNEDDDDNKSINDILFSGPIKKRKIDESIHYKEIKEIQNLPHPQSQPQPQPQSQPQTQSNDKDKDFCPESIPQKKDYKNTIKPSEIIIEIKEQETTKRIIDVDKYPYNLKCDELYNWFHITFIEWEKELEEVILSDPELAKSRMGIYKQCRGYIKTLLIHLKEKTVTKVILDKLFQVMVFCMDGDYIRAHDNYIELSIGNAPWPMGVTMVGIHERSGRSKIYTSQVAYILNDDITKKYLQSVKRIMTFIQRRYPKSPSKCVFS